MLDWAIRLVISLIPNGIANETAIWRLLKSLEFQNYKIFLEFFVQFILRKRTRIGDSREGADQVAIKVINLKTAQAAFVEKFLPRELDIARKLGLVERFWEKYYFLNKNNPMKGENGQFRHFCAFNQNKSTKI